MNGSGDPYDYDVAVVGGGSGGFPAARSSADAGLRTVLIDGGKEVGGLCILRGCMPSKALLHAAEVLHLARKAGTWGLNVGSAGFDFREVMDRISWSISRSCSGGSPRTMSRDGKARLESMTAYS
ncbi:MAG: FAD-dependent oxidoreductase [Akkermansiaceae bacterium]|jgi:pyruvate/2-oxoglutarate dehydrogenase complex dihydrolipoamide dehydrogenase (E3) component|nr:FAD-dependent oxidoreductase [Akkermansiaceae bacterium]MCU0776693.1 FAD-dependent oxidoreductase [Akkermansiaceae bacterium]